MAKPATRRETCGNCAKPIPVGMYRSTRKEGDTWKITGCEGCNDYCRQDREKADAEAQAAKAAQEAEIKALQASGGNALMSALSRVPMLAAAAEALRHMSDFASACAAWGHAPADYIAGAAAVAVAPMRGGGTLGEAIKTSMEWLQVLQTCARWGLRPGQTPAEVYLFPRGALQIAPTPYGLRVMFARSPRFVAMSEGAVFGCEAQLGHLAEQYREGLRRLAAATEARARGDEAAARADEAAAAAHMASADTTRAALEAREGGADGNAARPLVAALEALVDAKRRDKGARLAPADLNALAQRGKAAEDDTTRALFRRLYMAARGGDLDPADALTADAMAFDLRADFGAGLGPDERALLAGLRLPQWWSWGWWQWRGETTPPMRDLPDPAMWSPPRLDLTDPAGIPALIYATVTARTPDGTTATDSLHLDPDAFLKRAAKGQGVTYRDDGTLRFDNDTPWQGWAREMLSKTALHELRKRGPVAIALAREVGADAVPDLDDVIDARPAVRPADAVAYMRAQVKALPAPVPSPMDDEIERWRQTPTPEPVPTDDAAEVW